MISAPMTSEIDVSGLETNAAASSINHPMAVKTFLMVAKWWIRLRLMKAAFCRWRTRRMRERVEGMVGLYKGRPENRLRSLNRLSILWLEEGRLGDQETRSGGETAPEGAKP